MPSPEDAVASASLETALKAAIADVARREALEAIASVPSREEVERLLTGLVDTLTEGLSARLAGLPTAVAAQAPPAPPPPSPEELVQSDALREKVRTLAAQEAVWIEAGIWRRVESVVRDQVRICLAAVAPASPPAPAPEAPVLPAGTASITPEVLFEAVVRRLAPHVERAVRESVRETLPASQPPSGAPASDDMVRLLSRRLESRGRHRRRH